MVVLKRTRSTIEYMVFMTRVVYEFSLHDADRERLSIFPGAKRGELKGTKKEERLLAL